MADRCVILCADNLCIHNRANGHCYSVCALSELSGGTYGGITRSYVNTCPKKEPIPNCIARGPGKIAVFFQGRAGDDKSTLTMEKFLETMTFSFGEPRTITMDDVMSAIEQFKAVPKPEIIPWSPSPAQSYLPKFTWDSEKEEETP